MRGLAMLAVLSALGASGGAVQAAGGSIWDHNGSKMTLEENGDKRKLVYKELREGLDKAGIRAGTVLFNGEKKPNGRLAGFAKIFKGTCNPVDYFVEGTLDDGKGEIVLQGQAPVYSSGTSCEVTGYSDASPASTLRFAKIADAPGSAVVATRPPPGIEQGDGGIVGNNSDYLPPSSQGGRTASRPQEGAGQPPAPRYPSEQQGLAPRQPDRLPSDRADTQQDRGRTDPLPDRGRQATVDEDQEEPFPPADRDDRRYPYPDERRRFGDDRRFDDDRRFSRGPEREDRGPDRRRPGIWEPDEDLSPEDEEEFDRPPPPRSPFWGRRAW